MTTRPDLKTPLPCTFNFAHPEKTREPARRGEALSTLDATQMFPGQAALALW